MPIPMFKSVAVTGEERVITEVQLPMRPGFGKSMGFLDKKGFFFYGLVAPFWLIIDVE